MDDNVVLEGAIAIRVGDVENEHLHEAGLAIGGSRHVSVVGAAGVLDGDLNTIVGLGTPGVEVSVLEVERLLRETVAVGDIVDGVDNEESIGTSGVHVNLLGGSSLLIVLEDELLIGARLSRDVLDISDVCDGVVASG